jgi:hypothetical protein
MSATSWQSSIGRAESTARPLVSRGMSHRASSSARSCSVLPQASVLRSWIRRSAHSRAACRAKWRSRPVSAAETELRVWQGPIRRKHITAGWGARRTGRKCRNRIYVFPRRAPVRRSFIRPAKEAADNLMPRGFPAACKKRMRGPVGLPLSRWWGALTEMPNLPMIF